MYYIVFSRNHRKDSGLTSNLYYEGVSKTAAIEAFMNSAASTFNITSAPGNLYFAGFKSDLPFIKELKKLLLSDVATDLQPERREIINIALRNINSATCLNALNTSGYKPRFAVVHECTECDSDNKLVQKNVYGDYLCPDCWTEYWKTRKSLAEFVIGIANGIYKVESFNESDKEAIVDAWQNNELDEDDNEIQKSSNKAKLLSSEAYTEAELTAIENASGLFVKTTE